MGFVDDSDVAVLRDGRLSMLRISGIRPGSLSDSYLLSKLVAAEDYAASRMRVLFVPTRVLPENAAQQEIDALDASVPPVPWVIDPGYPVDPEAWHGERWGIIKTRHRPLISVESITFVYPQPMTTVFSVPAEWIRLDRKYGQISLLPGPTSLQVPLWALGIMGGGRVVPHVIQVRYVAGLENIRTKYPAVANLVYRLAVLGILKDQFLPQSGSISADGLSESASFDLDKFQDAIDKELDALRDAILGLRFVVL